MTMQTHHQAPGAALPGHDLPWLAELRTAAAARFAAAGLPDRKVEAWRYTDLKPIRERLYQPQRGPGGAVPGPLLPNSHRLIFNNGTLEGDQGERPDGVQLLDMAQAIARLPELLAGHLGQAEAVRHLPLPALNQAMSRNGYVLILAPGAMPAQPIEILFMNHEGAGYPRNLVLAGAGSQVTIVEHYRGAGDASYVVNAVTEIQLAAGARVNRYKIQQDGTGASHIGTVAADLADHARFENFDLNLGGRLTRSEIHVGLRGAGAEANLNGIYLLRERQHCDNTILMDHLAGDTNSQQDYRGILDGRSHGVFQGKITVRRNAQNISGHQLNKTLLLSDQAEIDCKPELEIMADNVKCSHGATAGELDESGLFYLRSRGIPEWEARRLLMRAFLGQTLNRAGDPAMREIMDAMVSEWMGA